MEYKQLFNRNSGWRHKERDITISEKFISFRKRFKESFAVGRYVSFYVNEEGLLCFKFFDECAYGRFCVSDSGPYHSRSLKTPTAFLEHKVPIGKYDVRAEPEDGYFVIEGCKIPKEEYRKL